VGKKGDPVAIDVPPIYVHSLSPQCSLAVPMSEQSIP
jgi:hypothetical protein